MRNRFTYLFNSIESIDPRNLTISKDLVSYTNSNLRAKEERVAVGRDELPPELDQLLVTCESLHIRWVSQEAYKSELPLISRLSPGLHVYYTPKKGTELSSLLCSLLEEIFGVTECVHPERSFTTRTDYRLSNTTSYQYYTLLPSILKLTDYLLRITCSQLSPNSLEYCRENIKSITKASSLDISFTANTRSLILSVFTSIYTDSAPITVLKGPRVQNKPRYEIGLLAPSPSLVPEEYCLSGFLTVIGEESSPKPTMFSFPSRHRPSNMSFKGRFLEPSGMHPLLELDIAGTATPVENQACELYVYLSLPRSIFVDKYQFLNALFLSENNIAFLRYIDDAVDLEAPEYALQSWGSSVLVKLAPPNATQNPLQQWKAHVPTHLRYLLPASDTGGYRYIEIPYPVLFWACTPEEISEFSSNPFDRTHLGYDDLFDSRTVFYHLGSNVTQGNELLLNKLKVPVLDLDKSRWVENLTILAIGCGLSWITLCLLKIIIKDLISPTMDEEISKEKKIE